MVAEVTPHGAQLRFVFDAPPPQVTASPCRPPVFVRHPRARRYVLRLLADGTLRVTIPRRGSQREAERFLLAQHAWVERQRTTLGERLAARPPRVWADGHLVLVHGTSHRLRHARGCSRDALRLEGHELIAETRAEGTDLHALITSWLWRLARVELPSRLRVLAAEQGLHVDAVSVRNQRTRWGSCAPNRRISLNWRLVQTPEAVRDYVLLHELMHLRQANHSRRFWKLVAAACPDYEASRRWLRLHERVLLDT